MVDGSSGKGDRYRKVDRKKWDAYWERKEAYEKKKKGKKHDK